MKHITDSLLAQAMKEAFEAGKRGTTSLVADGKATAAIGKAVVALGEERNALTASQPAELERLRERISRIGIDVDRALRGEVNTESPMGTTRLQAVAALAAGPAGSGGWQSHAEAMERERDHYRQRAQTMHEHQNGEAWYWQGDGCDHLESMVNSLPVVIRADQLRALIAAQQPVAPADPMDWPLPCDVTVGHGTMGKGVSLRTLVARMKTLYEMATGNNADEVANRTPEQNTALADAFRASVAAAPAQRAAAAYAPLTIAETRDLTCMLAGAPWPDEMLPELQRLLGIYDGLRTHHQRPVDPATLPRKVAKVVMQTGLLPATAQQPAPSAATPVQQGADYAPMQGLSAYLRAEVIGVRGIASETLRRWAAEVDTASAPQPSPTPQADSQPAPVLWVSPEQFEAFTDSELSPHGKYIPARKTSAGKFTMPLFADRAARAPADSVLEDAARTLIEAIEYTPLGVRAITAMNQVRVAIAARKQGGA